VETQDKKTGNLKIKMWKPQDKKTGDLKIKKDWKPQDK
jgi:hypothetical protein